MASTSSPTTPSWKHDVFLSFRGKDTRYGFTRHLHAALKRNQIDAFIDDKLNGGEKLEPALLKRIEDSYISVVIFSENYADSTFCLRELSKIHECMETKGQKVLPVFHQLDPSQVQDLSGSYGEALSRHQEDCAPEEVESWRHASKEIANLKGWDSSVIKDETKLIEEIVSDIQRKLHHAPSTSIDAKGLVGMQSRVEHIESLLSLGSTGVLIVGIWGMGGIGKSTTAEAVYNRNSHTFEGRCFFRNVREESKNDRVLHVRQEILRVVLENKDLNIDTKVLPPDIKRMLQRKKVLIVLDDVSDAQHLKFLVGEDGLFGEGSRIIATSRDRQVLINACQANRIYKVNDLDEDDALRLFSFHAFKQNNPPDRYTKLSKEVVSCVKGIPLVLEVLGASLYTKTSVEYWESKVAQLRTNGGEDIKKRLKMCYDELDPTEKKIFLDIACFFGRCTRDYLQQTLDLEERSGIDRLIDMCLIKIVENEIQMHDVLLKLGRKIVVQENVDPRQRSRLWDAKDVYRVLTTQGTGKVESISLDLSETKEIELSPATFEGMYNLRLLKFYYPYPCKERVRIHLPQGLHSLSNELRVLHWCDYPLKSLPSNLFPEKLVVLEMHRSQLEQLWNVYQLLENLKLMNLRSSSKLILIDSDLSKVPNLEVLTLGECGSCSVGLPSSIEHCTKLTILDLSDHVSLCTLPSSIGFLSQLVKLDLSFCSSLTCLPDSIGELKSLVELDLHCCSKLASLPSSIGKLTCLVKLNLSVCSELASLPESIGELKSLVKLDLFCCSKLPSLPNSICGLESRKSFNLGNYPRRSEVEEIASTTNKLGCLQHLNMRSCGVLEIPGSIGSWVSLKILIFSRNNFERIPANIKQLPTLIELDLHGCERLQHLPQLPSSLQVLIASDCISLKSVAGIFMQGEKDYEAASQQFNFSDCLQLDQNSLTKIIGDARLRIQHMTTSLFNQQYFGKPIRVQLCIPGLEVPEWFTYKNTGGPTVKIKLPAHLQLFGLTLCAVVSFGPGQKYRRGFDIKCECHLITKDGTQSDLSFHYNKGELNMCSSWKREHVFIWSINSSCFFKEASFHFTLLGEITTDVVVLQSGVHPLFVVEDYIDDAQGLVGMQSRVQHIESLLSFGSTGLLIVGIWGMGGIGKSTTAKAVYKRNSHKFEGRCFFPNVREETKKHGIDHVRQEILREVLETKVPNIDTIELPSDFKRMLQSKKVLIVLDDVSDAQNLKFLVGEDGLFGQGSRIMVTSRDKLINACQDNRFYEVTDLDEGDALRLFSLHAFQQNNPLDGYTTLSKNVVSCVKGIPLVLEVLGASLYSKTSVEYWESKVAQLRTNRGEDIKKSLKMCYDELDRTEKKIFLDIACFFGRCTRDYLQQTLDLEERSGIDRLIDKCLIKIVQNEIWMHDVLLNLGRDIVAHENADPRQRSRLWDAKDVYRVLTTQGTGKVESISLDLSKTKEINVSPAAFEGMNNLRLLKFYYPYPCKERVIIHLPQGLHFLSNELRILYWCDYPLKSFPSNFFPEKLVVLEMPRSELEQLWNENQPLENLKLMNLCYSKLILSDFDFRTLPNLEVLNLDKCSFSEVGLPCTLPPSIGILSQLVKLSLSFNRSLTCLPDSISELKSLVELNLDSCYKLASLPSSIGQLKCLVELILDGCSLASLPKSIGELKSLVKLYICRCKNLSSLPDSIGELKCLEELHLVRSEELASLPQSIGELKSLVRLHLSYCLKLSSLPDSFGELKCLAELDLHGCSVLASLPDSFGGLKCLAELDLRGCSVLASLPDSFGGLKCLAKLNLIDCSELASLPDSIGELKCLAEFYLIDCSKLASLPNSIYGLVSLKSFNLYRCYKLNGFPSLNRRLPRNDSERIPATIMQFPMLIELNLKECKRLQHLPQLPSSLQVLDATDCISLTSVGGIFMQGCDDYEAGSQDFNFSGCLQLDQNSLTKIIGDARLRIERMATSLFKQQYFGKPISVRLCIPGSEVPEWFAYKNTRGPTVQIPAHWHRANTTDQLFGFTLCIVVSFGPFQTYPHYFDIKCECHLITKDGPHSYLTFHYDEHWGGTWYREHVFIWSIHSDFFFKEASFHFQLLIPDRMENAAAVVQSGVHPLFVEDYIDKPEQQQPKRLKLMGNRLTIYSLSSI